MGDLINNKTIQMGVDGLPNNDVSHVLASEKPPESRSRAGDTLARCAAWAYAAPSSDLTREVPCSDF